MKYLFFGFLLMQVISCNAQKSSPIEFKASFEKEKDAILIDVRTPDEFKSGSIGKSINIDYNDPKFEEKIHITIRVRNSASNLPCNTIC